MVKPHVGIETEKSSFLLSGFQAEDRSADRVGSKIHRGLEPRAPHQGFNSCPLERPVPRARGSDLWPNANGEGADRRAGAGDRASTHGTRDLKKSIQEAPVAERTRLARKLKAGYPVRTVCRLLGVPRSSVLYQVCPKRDLEPLAVVVQHSLVTFPTAGYRLMYKILRRQHVACTRNEVRKVYAGLGLLRKRAAALKYKTTDSRHEHERYPNIVKKLKVDHPDQVWVADTTELRVSGRRAFLAREEDVLTRRVIGFALSLANNSVLTTEALDMALRLGVPEIHHSDQGKTYASEYFTGPLLKQGVRISMAAAGCAWENGYAERLNRTFKEEEILRSEYESLDEARNSIAAYVNIYNQQRLHMSIGYRTPQEVYLAHAPRPA